MTQFLEDCFEAVINEILADEVTAILVGVPFLICFGIPLLFAWVWWPRKKPFEYLP